MQKKLTIAGFCVLIFLTAMGQALAATCQITSATPLIQHDVDLLNPDTSVSFCELCNTGSITIIISNPYGDNDTFPTPSDDDITDMINMVVEEDLGSTGLTYVLGSTELNINGGGWNASSDPDPSSLPNLVWTSTQIPALANLAGDPAPGVVTDIAIRFSVVRNPDPEGLADSALNRNITSNLTYTAEDRNSGALCTAVGATANQTVPLPLREPNPTVEKLGRNVDAGQDSGEYYEDVYGNNDDDIIWRIEVDNSTGTADLQDLRLDDILDVGSENINDLRFICGSEGDATAVANNNGVDAGGVCVPFPGAPTDRILNYDVDLPFSSPTTVDVAAGDSGYLYLVGKIPAPNGSCSTDRVNTVSDIQWGCDTQAPAGGIDETSSSASPGSDTATLNTLADISGSDPLTIVVDYDGINPGDEDPGMRGRVIIDIRNYTGGTVSDLVLTNALPDEYVVDETFTPTIAATGAYGDYDGLTNEVDWNNPDLTGTPLLNTDPRFILTSDAATNDGHANLLRHGDRLVITFGVVLVHQPLYDLQADLDVTEEDPDDGNTDPPTWTNSPPPAETRNLLDVEYENFCTAGTKTQQSEYTPIPRPEDLDVETYGPSGPVLDYILTNSTTTTLSVVLTNNGGHSAEDYYAYVAFGETMVVETPDPRCSDVHTKAPPSVEWQTPIDFPATAAVYECTDTYIRHSGANTRRFDFVVRKVTVTDLNGANRLIADDLTFRADVIGEITLSNGTPLTFPAVVARGDGITDPANNYTIDAVRARVMGFNLDKEQDVKCSENPAQADAPPDDDEVQIGEDCSFNIRAGGWFGFKTPGYEPIYVQNVRVDDVMPAGQGYVDRSAYSNTAQVNADPISFLRVGGPPHPSQYDMEEGTIYWEFNNATPITQRDEWFEVDVITRILNEAVNQHEDPSRNILTSTFDVIFLANQPEPPKFTVSYGPSMSVYPPESVRRVTLTVTEPNIRIVKEVCNESLTGIVGPGCGDWQGSVSDGDALNDYIYRITLTNDDPVGSPTSVTRAPAYDITVTDTLDNSDLALIYAFDSDGLDNDGDGATDEADEGSISNNTVLDFPLDPAVITFSHTHSSALLRLDDDGSSSVVLYYRVNFDDNAAPNQSFINEAVAAYDSLEGLYGNQSDNTRTPPSPYGTSGDARYYTSPTASATVQMIPIEAQPKSIFRLSEHAVVAGDPQGVYIGEEIDYRLNTLLPVALLRDFVIRDKLPDGLTCAEAPVLNLGPSGPYAGAGFIPNTNVTPQCNDPSDPQLVEWDFGDRRITNGTAGLTNRYAFEIGFIARVDNSGANNNGVTLANGGPDGPGATSYAYVRYTDETLTNTITQEIDPVTVEVREPLIALTKGFSAPNPDAADVLTVTVTATNNGTAPAYNLGVMDDLTSTNLTYIGNVAGGNPPDIIDNTTVPNRPVFSWSAPNNIDPTDSISFTFEVRVNDGVQPMEVLANTIEAKWTSLPGQSTALNTSGAIGNDGDPDGMRIGTVPNTGTDPINDYETTAADDVAVPAITMTKTDLNPGVDPAVGEHKEFQIEIVLPEGVTNDLVVTDTLNAGGLSYFLENEAGPLDITYTFQGIATINGSAPSEAALGSFPADETTNTATWDFGRVVTQTENDTSVNTIDPLIRITYFARINNDAVSDAGDTVQNSVALVYYDIGASGPLAPPLTDDTPVNDVVEPSLGMTKAMENLSNPGNAPLAGHTLRYTLTFTAAGGGNNSDAYDLRIDDSLSLGLVYSGNPTVSAGGTISDPVITGDGVTTPQTLRWSLEDGNADIDIAAGSVVTITYDVVVDNSVGIGLTLSNSATAEWTSIDGINNYERDGSGAPWHTSPGPAYDDYFTGPATTSDTVDNLNTFTKSRLDDTFDGTDNVVRIGDIVEYELRLGIQPGTHNALFATDTLPQGLIFEEIVSINGVTSAPYSDVGPFVHTDIPASNIVVAGDAATGPTTLTITLGNVVNTPDGNPANDFFVIIYRARVMNLVHNQQNNIALTNSAAMGYGSAPGVTDGDTIDVRQPNLSVAKTAVAAGGDTVLASGELVTYTVDITNGGTAPAYDSVLQDIIPVGMRNAVITTSSIEMPPGNPLPGPHPAPAYDSATGIVTWDLDTGTADQYTIPVGETLRIVYRAQADASLGPGMTLTNLAQVMLYYSFDDDAVPTEGGAVGEREIYGPSNTASVTLTTEAAASLDKANTVASAAIGEPFTYRITVPDSPQDTALHDVRIIDDLSTSAAELVFIQVTKVSGSEPWTPVNTGTGPNLVIEDTTVGIDIPAREQIEIDITVMLVDSDTNVSGLTFANTASYTYNQISDDPDTQANGGGDTTGDMIIVGPDQLTAEKSGPATMLLGTPAGFILNIQNTSNSTAWNPTIMDILPSGATGGTCDRAPSNVTAEVFEADGTTLVRTLVEDTDFTVSFSGEPDCQWRLELLSASGGIEPTRRLIITYDTELDSDTQNGESLTNIAGITQWYSFDPNAADAAPRTYTNELSDGTVSILDDEDAHTTDTEAPVLEFNKHVINVTTGQDPGLDASPGDTLRYTLEVINSGPVGLPDFSITDDLDGLNLPPVFVAGSLVLISTPVGSDTSGTDPVGGANGTGLVVVDNMTIGAQGEANDTVTLVFEVTLAPVIDSGTVVLNQAGMVFYGLEPLLSDDINIDGTTDPTETLIDSAPVFQVEKTSTYMEGDPAVLMAGEILRYTITIKNIGDENAVEVRLRDYIPANTTYVADSTTLNGNALADPSPGVSPLQDGFLVNAPEDLTPGAMRADTAPDATNVATVTFDVVVDADAMDGLVIENQGFVSGEGAGSGDQPEQPSDDPDTDVPDDPTRDVVGNLPLLYAHKTVALSVDNNGNGFVDPGDVLLYSITISNSAAIPATDVVLTDAVPTNTTYLANSLRLNGAALPPDGGVSPLIAGLSVQSSDNPGDGIISAGESATITFEATVNAGVPTGTIISNQGTVTSDELVPLLTDADGLPANGYQPTIIVVGDAQLLTITKTVSVVGGSMAMAGGQLEYVVRVTNAGSVPATDLVITDDLNPPLGTQVTYVAGSGTLDGAVAGIAYAANILSADFAAAYGDLAPGSSCELRFRVQIGAAVPMGTRITNTGEVTWNNPPQSDSASVSIDVGGTPGSGTLNGNVWHDANLNVVNDNGEISLVGWTVTLYRNTTLVATITTDASGVYQFSGLLPNNGTTDRFVLRFSALGAGANAAAVGYADSIFVDGPHRISDIVVASGENLQNLNLPIQPNGTVYDSIMRTPINGAALTLRNAVSGAVVSDQCLDDPGQQGQVTADEGFYKFDMNFSQPSCPAGDTYLIEVTSPATGYLAAPSLVIPPESDSTTAAFSIPACPGSASDAVPATPGHCEAITNPIVPPVSVPPRTAGTRYYLHLLLNDGSMPGESQIYNNPIPIDPEMEGFTAITKTVSKTNVSRGSLVPYTITVTNLIGAPLYDVTIIDRFPAGFKYVEGSARLNGTASEPRINGLELHWEDLVLQVNEKHTIQMLLVVGSGVSEGEYVNRAQVSNGAIGDTISGEATATVRVVPDPDFDCSDVIGKVFDDVNLNGRQDNGELGLTGVRVVTVRGLISTTDQHGRFHITCAAVPDEDRGSNFILKLDERSLPSGYRLTTENPRVQRATRGKMLRYNFGATIHSVVRIDIADGVFEPDTTELRIQWTGKIDELIEALQKTPSVLRLSYLGDVESKSLVKRRLKTLKKIIAKQWKESDGGYALTIETEVFWRRGAPFRKRR